MLVAALAATVAAVALAAGQQRWFADVGNRRDQVQAQSLALAGVQWARQIPCGTTRAQALDFLGEPWSYPLPPTPIANGSIEGRIEDAQGRLNVNNLVQDGAAGEMERMRFAQLFARKGACRDRSRETLADWIDADAQRRPNGGGRRLPAGLADVACRQRAARAQRGSGVRAVPARTFAAPAYRHRQCAAHRRSSS